MTVLNLAQEDRSTGQAKAWASPATKQYASLSREHSLALLHKLSTDDGFRRRFEQSPIQALFELGVPHSTIFSLKEECRIPKQLVEKSHFALAYKELAGATVDVCLGMSSPNLRIDLGRR